MDFMIMKLSKEKIDLLNSIDEWFWERNFDDKWIAKFNDFKDFIKHKNCI